LDRRTALATTLATMLMTGCTPASTPSPMAETPAPAPSAKSDTAAPATTARSDTAAPAPSAVVDEVSFKEDPHLQRVWVADGFRFTGYTALLITETRADVPKLDPDGVENLEWAKGVLRDELAMALRTGGFFPVVGTREADVVPAGGKALRLDNTIVEYEKGGGGARFFAGLYGAGQPVIKVRGRMTADNRSVFVFEARRSGDTGLARMFGGYRSDKDIQEEDIRDLAKDLADFIDRTAKAQP